MSSWVEGVSVDESPEVVGPETGAGTVSEAGAGTGVGAGIVASTTAGADAGASMAVVLGVEAVIEVGRALGAAVAGKRVDSGAGPCALSDASAGTGAGVVGCRVVCVMSMGLETVGTEGYPVGETVWMRFGELEKARLGSAG